MTNQYVKKVLIVGGGISGLTAAVALHKIGIEAEIVEKELEWNVYGVGIIQPPNALRALNEIGLADECVKQGFGHPGFDYYTGQGDFMFHGDSPTIKGYPGVNGISRRKLHDILYTAVETIGTKIYMGSTVNKIENVKNGVYVELSNGISAFYDMVIGADGSHSKVRKLMFGDIVQNYSGQGVWRYTLPKPKEMDRGLFYYGQTAKAGLVPMSDESMYLLVTTQEPGNPRFPNDQLAVLLQERLTEFGGAIAEAASLVTDSSKVVYRPIFTHFLSNPWYKGNVLLVGDAAHGTAPHLGQGASIAIEDVIVLADLLKLNFEAQETLRLFMEKRYERCKLICENSDQLVEWELLTWNGQMKSNVNVGKYVYETLEKMNEPFLSEINTI
ncbi:FAD-dependent monooxygenase [Bacillus sp. ISL-46]|uniref:FAD-dependent monooxygenase n=1 Tax=Bacillus sp. ISL-46 TaxID=2819129 RepID=UPI001BE9DE77|nr:FAD-dependent monooxygenase [Bacillus sp. ISL-46]MBT2721150.1 FAD-dependent monooxygenase [Bacillus sp. ISL-46]